jgi:hypothetical protein
MLGAQEGGKGKRGPGCGSTDGHTRSTSTSWFPACGSFDDAGLNELDCTHNTRPGPSLRQDLLKKFKT